jgi:hypothetical protein
VVADLEPKPRLRPSQCNIEVMPKKEIFGFEPAARLENIAEE